MLRAVVADMSLCFYNTMREIKSDGWLFGCYSDYIRHYSN